MLITNLFNNKEVLEAFKYFKISYIKLTIE